MTGWRKKQIDDAMAGDGGYEIGTQEGYEAFVKVRNQSLAKMRIRELMLQAGTDTSGKWMNTYHAEKFAELIIKECSYLADQAHHKATNGKSAGGYIRQQFGVEE